jgi:hypothetical protein
MIFNKSSHHFSMVNIILVLVIACTSFHHLQAKKVFSKEELAKYNGEVRCLNQINVTSFDY